MKNFLHISLLLALLPSCAPSNRFNPVSKIDSDLVAGETADSTQTPQHPIDPFFLHFFTPIDINDPDLVAFMNKNPSSHLDSNLPVKIHAWKKSANASELFANFAATVIQNLKYDRSYRQYHPDVDLFYESNFSPELFAEAQDCLKAAEEALLWTAYSKGFQYRTVKPTKDTVGINNGMPFTAIQFVYKNGYNLDADFEALLFEVFRLDQNGRVIPNMVDGKADKEGITKLMEKAIVQRHHSIGKFFPPQAYTFKNYLKENKRTLNRKFFEVKKSIEDKNMELWDILVEALNKVQIAEDKITSYKKKFETNLQKTKSLGYHRSMKLLQNQVSGIAQEMSHYLMLENLEGSEFEDMLLKSVVAHLSRMGITPCHTDFGNKMEISMDVFSLYLVNKTNLIREDIKKSIVNDPVRYNIPYQKSTETEEDLMQFLDSAFVLKPLSLEN